MSLSPGVNLNVAAGAVATGGTALKTLQGGTADASDAASATAVPFTLDEAGHSMDAGSMTTPLARIGKGSQSVGLVPNPKDKSAASSAASATDGTLLSILQSFLAAPAGIASAAIAPNTAPATAAGVEASAAAVASGNAAKSSATSSPSAVPGISGLPVSVAATVSQPTASLQSDAPSSDASEDSAAGAAQSEANAKAANTQSLAATGATTLSAQSLANTASQISIVSAASINSDGLVAAMGATKQARQDSRSATVPAAAAGSAGPAPGSVSVVPAATSDVSSSIVNSLTTPIPSGSETQQGTAQQAAGATTSASSPAAAVGTGSSSLFAALTQTLADATAGVVDTAASAAQPAQTVSAAFSSLMQQITGGSTLAGTSSPTAVQHAAPGDLQLASAVSTATLPTLAMTMPTAVAMDPGMAANAAAVQTPIDTTQQNWPDALGGRVEWLLHQGLQEARIELHPQDMGSINVHIKLGNDGADVRFAATNPNVRDALESSLPKLRELLAGGGLQLAQAQVGSQMQQQESSGRFLPQQAPAHPSSPASTGSSAADAQPSAGIPRVKVAQVSIIDDYA